MANLARLVIGIVVTIGIVVLLIGVGLYSTQADIPNDISVSQIKPTSETQPNSDTVQADNALSNSVITGTKDIPLYPGSQTTSITEDIASVEIGEIEYHAQIPGVSFQQLTAFYKDKLLQNGWIILSENDTENVSVLDLVWKNTMEGPPTRRYIRVGVDQHAPEVCYLNIWLQRWPENDKIPEIQEAQQVKTTLEKHPYYGFYIHVTKYVTAANSSEVESYYRDIMPQYGWGVISLDYPESGIAFRGKTSTVVLQSRPTDEGKTEVTLKTWGDGAVISNEQGK